jgi:hypothetical protein
VITPTFGSIVQKGKFAACALALLRQLKRVDFPTFGKPTIPHCKLMAFVLVRRESSVFFLFLKGRGTGRGRPPGDYIPTTAITG